MIKACYKKMYRTLASRCSSTNWFMSYFVANLEDGFTGDVTQLCKRSTSDQYIPYRINFDNT